MQIAKIYRIERDVAVILLSIVCGAVLVKTGLIHTVIAATDGFEFIDSFVAGMFFTSVFTTFPAMAALGEIAQTEPLFMVALAGGTGALIGDLILFRFLRDSVANDLYALVGKSGRARLRALFHVRYLRWLLGLAGALVIASPLPDELGLAMMGLSKVKTSLFIPASFAMNFLGILIIGLIARSLQF